MNITRKLSLLIKQYSIMFIFLQQICVPKCSSIIITFQIWFYPLKKHTANLHFCCEAIQSTILLSSQFLSDSILFLALEHAIIFRVFPDKGSSAQEGSAWRGFVNSRGVSSSEKCEPLQRTAYLDVIS